MKLMSDTVSQLDFTEQWRKGSIAAIMRNGKERNIRILLLYPSPFICLFSKQG